MWLLKSLFGRNLGVKLLSLILAISLWYAAVGRERAEVGLNVPLEMINFPANMVVADEVPDGISLRIRGPVALTRQAADRNLRFSLDMSQAKPGPNQFNLSPDALGLPRGLEVTHLAPKEVTVDLEQVETKKLSILPVIKGEPVTGYIIDDIVLEPKQIEVRGPKSVIDMVDILWTEPVDVTKLTASATVLTKPNLPDPSLRLTGPAEINVQLKISEKIITRVIKEVAVTPEQPADGIKDFKLKPKVVDITVRGPLNTMGELVAGKGLTVRVPLAGLEPGKHERLPIVNAPKNVEVVKIEPKVVEITIHHDIVESE